MSKHNLIFAFDLDNTLVETNFANNESYKEAILAVTGMEISVKLNYRLTRKDLISAIPMLSAREIEEIINIKETIFCKYINKTLLNEKLFLILKALYKNGNETILLTNCHKIRAQQVCDYYNLNQYFSSQFFYEDYSENKYKFLIDKGYKIESVVLFENEDIYTREAVNYGINISNIIKVKY